MESGDLIRQKKNRVVYSSSIGQTKPANKTRPSTSQKLIQLKLGPKEVYDGNQVVLPACTCNP